MEKPESSVKKRILLYSHDAYGLGNISRTLKIAKQLAVDLPNSSQLLLTGSACPACFQLPQNLDYIKLPAIKRINAGEYVSSILPLELESIKSLREGMIFEAACIYKPDLLLVDRSPTGIEGELTRTLRYLKLHYPQTKLILGMRDIDDSAKVVRKIWKENHAYELLEDIYDWVLLYGERKVFDPVSQYGLSVKVTNKIIECGYQGDFLKLPCPASEVRKQLPLKHKTLVVVTVGGGEDGFKIVVTYLKMLLNLQKKNKLNFDSLVVTGPLMGPAQKAIINRYQSLGLPLTIRTFIADLVKFFQIADLIIAMGGYNTVSEILSLKKRAVIIPRIKPKVEQLMRAKRLAKLGLVNLLHPSKLSENALFTQIKNTLRQKNISSYEAGIEIGGVKNVSHIVSYLLNGGAKKMNKEINYNKFHQY